MAKRRLADTLTFGYLLICSMIGWIPLVSPLDIVDGYENEKACYGTSTGFTNRGDPTFRYEQYKEKYDNCTYLAGNLEIVFLDEPGAEYDLSFLSKIREVTGYVLIAGNFINYIPLTNLQIIRGMTLFHYQKTNQSFSLFVAVNFEMHGNVGLKELRFKSLTEILNGKVFFQNNNHLCFENTIDWTDINPHITPPVMFKSDSKLPQRKCGECHEDCLNKVTNKRHCWGEGPDMCQILNHGKVCHDNCGDSRCYGSLPNQCCHPECAGGCTGPRKTDCFACRNFLDEEGCVAYCPREIVYHREKMMNVRNPNVKYAFGAVCVKECPGFLLQDAGFCVRQCAEGKHAADQRNCKTCNGPCPKPTTVDGLISTTTVDGGISTPNVDGGISTPTTTSITQTSDGTNLPQASSRPSRHDLKCHLTSMTVHIPVSLAPNSKLMLRDPQCVLTNNGTHHVTTFAYDTCGTSVTFYQDYKLAENEVKVHMNLNGGSSVAFDKDYSIPLKCQIVASQKVAGAFQAGTREPTREESTDLNPSSFVLREFKTSLYQEEITHYPVMIPLNREIYVELALNNSKANSLGLKVNQCTATPTTDPLYPINFKLLYKGCPVTTAAHVQPRPGPDRFRFSVQAFHFQGDSDQDHLVFIHCDVSLCPVLDCDVTCDGKRRRNEGFGPPSVTLTSGPHLVVH